MWRSAGGQALCCPHDHLGRASRRMPVQEARAWDPAACARPGLQSPGRKKNVTVRTSARQLSLRRPSGATLARPSSRGSVSQPPTQSSAFASETAVFLRLSEHLERPVARVPLFCCPSECSLETLAGAQLTSLASQHGVGAPGSGLRWGWPFLPWRTFSPLNPCFLLDTLC